MKINKKIIKWFDGTWSEYCEKDDGIAQKEITTYNKDGSIISLWYYIDKKYFSLQEYKSYLVKERLEQNSPQDEAK